MDIFNEANESNNEELTQLRDFIDESFPMEEYCKKYTKMLKFDPFRDADYYREHAGSDEGGNTTQNGNTTWNVYSDTPQGALTNVANETYLTDARKITDNGNTSGTFNSTDEYLDHIYGKMPGRSYQSLLKELRETLINIYSLCYGGK